MKVTCPQCKKKTIYDKDNAFRPFCSERCKLIDLGAWANQEYVISRSILNPEYSIDEKTSNDEDFDFTQSE